MKSLQILIVKPIVYLSGLKMSERLIISEQLINQGQPNYCQSDFGK